MSKWTLPAKLLIVAACILLQVNSTARAQLVCPDCPFGIPPAIEPPFVIPPPFIPSESPPPAPPGGTTPSMSPNFNFDTGKHLSGPSYPTTNDPNVVEGVQQIQDQTTVLNNNPANHEIACGGKTFGSIVNTNLLALHGDQVDVQQLLLVLGDMHRALQDGTADPSLFANNPQAAQQLLALFNSAGGNQGSQSALLPNGQLLNQVNALLSLVQTEIQTASQAGDQERVQALQTLASKLSVFQQGAAILLAAGQSPDSSNQLVQGNPDSQSEVAYALLSYFQTQGNNSQSAVPANGGDSGSLATEISLQLLISQILETQNQTLGSAGPNYHGCTPGH